MEMPLPEPWWRVLQQNVALSRRLSDADRARLAGLIQLFLDEKTFEGLGGQEIDDEVRVTIAGQACLLLLGLDEVEEPYPDVKVVRVYPKTYRAPRAQRTAGVVTEGTSRLLGQSSRHGYVIVSWKAAKHGGRVGDDGHNVVLHEFAHQLDTADGRADGAPILQTGDQYGPWAEVLGGAYEQLREDARRHRRNVMDRYGATNPAEFFAVATETFFEQPRGLRRQEPELYAVLCGYYRQDPADHVGRQPDSEAGDP
jgi:hypothetical protein